MTPPELQLVPASETLIGPFCVSRLRVPPLPSRLMGPFSVCAETSPMVSLNEMGPLTLRASILAPICAEGDGAVLRLNTQC